MWAEVKGNLIRMFVEPAGRRLFRMSDTQHLQQQTLRYLLARSADTALGRHFNFKALLQLPDHELESAYRQCVPVFHYLTIEDPWWQRTASGEPGVCWGGPIRNIGLSSGTTSGSSKLIPVSDDMIRTTKLASRAFVAHALHLGINADALGRHVLSIGGSITLSPKNGLKYGTFSGIVSGQSPWYWQSTYKPGKAGQALTNWSEKIEYIARHAATWDIGAMYGFPCWVTPILEKISEQHGVERLTDLWPNLRLYAFSGMKIDPYRERLRGLLGPELPWLETYVASEGYFAIQHRLNQPGMRILTNNEIYYELIPFNDDNFDEMGYPRPDAQAIPLQEAIPGLDYALTVTNNSGAWRYVPGDVIRLEQQDPPLITFVGRTALYINDCSERLSIGNLEAAFTQVVQDTGITSTDFAVQSIAVEDYFIHRWYVECPDLPPDTANKIDHALCQRNDNYHRMRNLGVIREVNIIRLEPGTFHRYLAATGRANGQSKTPRVLKGNAAIHWEEWLSRPSNAAPNNL